MTKRTISVILCIAMVLSLFLGIPMPIEAATEMTASQSCIAYLKNMEGFSAVPFWDYAQWTIGFGNRCPEADRERYEKEGIPIQEAHELFAKQLSGFVSAVNSFVQRNQLVLTQSQFDALVSLAYNKGGAWMYKDNDPLVLALLEGNYDNTFFAAYTISCMAGGEFLPGLMQRRLSEVNMFLNGVYSIRQPANYCHVQYDAGEGKRSVAAQGYDCNLPAQPLATATRPGYVFMGWHTAADGGVPVTTLDRHTNGMTLYAHWQEDTGNVVVPQPPESVTVMVTGAELVNVRIGPGMEHATVGTVSKNTYLAITDVVKVNGVYWGEFEMGWMCLTYSTYDPSTVENDSYTPSTTDRSDTLPDLPMEAVVVSDGAISIHSGPHQSYPVVGSFVSGDAVVITETYAIYSTIWGKCEQGWIRTDQGLMYTNYEKLAHPFVATVTNYFLSVRSGPSTNFTRLDTIYRGTKLSIVTVRKVDGEYWGQSASGWVSLSYTDFNAELLSQYENHTFGQWRVKKSSTYLEEGILQTQCQSCKSVQERSLGRLPLPVEVTYGTLTGNAFLNIRESRFDDAQILGTLKMGERVQILEQKEYDNMLWGRIDRGWICITGYMTLEDRFIDPQTGNRVENIPVAPYQVLGVLVCCNGRLNIRSGAGTDNPLVGQLADGARVEILNRKVINGQTWGQIPEGWICLTGNVKVTASDTELTRYTKTFANLMNSDVTLYSDSTAAVQVGVLKVGTQVQVLEYTSVYGEVWVRTFDGWFRMEPGILLEVISDVPWDQPEEPQQPPVTEPAEPVVPTEPIMPVPPVTEPTTSTGPEILPAEPEKVYAVVSDVYMLPVRLKPTNDSTLMARLYWGDRVEILEILPVGQRAWGRIDNGWILLTGNTVLEYGPAEPATSEPSVDTVPPTTAPIVPPTTAPTAPPTTAPTVPPTTAPTIPPTTAPTAPPTTSPTAPPTTAPTVPPTTAPAVPPTTAPAPEMVDRTFGTVTYAFLNVRSGPSSAYSLVSQLSKGDRVEILDQKLVSGSLWVRFELGWVCATGHMTLETVSVLKDAPVKLYGTLTGNSFLNIRAGCGTGYTLAGQLYKGDRVQILELKLINGQIWGRSDRGWFCISGYITLTATEDTAAI